MSLTRPDEEVEAALAAAVAVQEALGSAHSDDDDEDEDDDDRKLKPGEDALNVFEHEDEEEEPPAKKSRTERVRRVGRVPKMDLQGFSSASAAEGHSTLGQIAASNPWQSKHDQKWNNMFNKLLEYKKIFNSTLVPQCYDLEPSLGRWVHYQRVEYWLLQSRGKAKITPDRIARLESIGFEWDPQKASWEKNYKKLHDFEKDHGHCKVPKGYPKDPELANWVRNQRLEHTKMQCGKKTSMTGERLKLLDAIGFKWSVSKNVDTKKK